MREKKKDDMIEIENAKLCDLMTEIVGAVVERSENMKTNRNSTSQHVSAIANHIIQAYNSVLHIADNMEKRREIKMAHTTHFLKM